MPPGRTCGTHSRLASPPTLPTLGGCNSSRSIGGGSCSFINPVTGGEDYTQDGLAFWKEAFGRGRLVAWPRFVEAVGEMMRTTYPGELQGFVELEDVLRYLIDRSEGNRARNLIALEEWAVFLHRFGPLECCIGKAARSFFVVTEGGTEGWGEMVPWFHGNITRQKAKEIVLGGGAGKRPGSFLVRFSATNPRNFTLTYLDEGELKHKQQQQQQQQQQQVISPLPATYKNVLLHNRGPLGFALDASAPEEECFPTVRELVDCKHGWSLPCSSELAAGFRNEVRQRRSSSTTTTTTTTTITTNNSSVSCRSSPPIPLHQHTPPSLAWTHNKSVTKSSCNGLTTAPSSLSSSSTSIDSAVAAVSAEGSSDAHHDRHNGQQQRRFNGRKSHSSIGWGEGAREGGTRRLSGPLRNDHGLNGRAMSVGGGKGGVGLSKGMMDSPVFSPEGNWEDEEGGEGEEDEAELEREEEVRRDERAHRNLDGEDEDADDEEDDDEEDDGVRSQTTLASSGGKVQGRRRRRRRRRSGSSNSPDDDNDDDDDDILNDEDEDDDDDDNDDDDEEEEEDEEEETEGHEPSELEMRQRLRLLHTMSSVSSLDEAATLLNKAMLSTASGKYEEALRLLDDVLGVAGAEYATMVEADMQARAAKVKGTILQEMGLMKEASVWYELSVRAGHLLLRQVPISEDIGEYFAPLRYVHNQLTQFYLSVHAYNLVLEHFEQLLALTDNAAERRLILREFERLSLEHDFWQDVTPGMLDQELEQGKGWYREGKLEEATLQFRRVVQLARLASFSSASGGRRLMEARALGNYATVLKDLHKCDDAILSYRLCCRILQELDEGQMERRMLNGLSLCLMERERWMDAKEVCGKLLGVTEREDNMTLVRARMEEIEEQLRKEEERKEEGEEGWEDAQGG